MNTSNLYPEPISSPIYFTYSIILALLFLLLFNSCIEEKIDPLHLGSIHGIVLSKSSNDPIPEVEVSTIPATSVIYTNSEGKFEFLNIPEGEYTVVVQADNYARKSVKTQVTRNSGNEITVKLSNSNILAPAPSEPLPIDGAIDQPLELSLNWTINEISADSIIYSIKLYESTQTSPYLEVDNYSDTSLLVNNLKYNTTYYWQVQARSTTGYTTSGELWLFKTLPFPDNQILFTSATAGNYEIYSSNEVGSTLTRITYSSYNEFKPQYSKDRSRIAFSSNAKINYHIYTMNKDGSGITQVTSVPIAGNHNQGIGFSWSPDNGKFVYSHYDKLYRIDKDGVNLTLIATAPPQRNFRAVDWTVVNDKIVIETIGTKVFDSEIYIMNANGSDTVRIVDNLPGIIESPSFTIDGGRILFTRDVSGYEQESGRQLDARIFIMDIHTKIATDISGGKPIGTNDLQPRISPDGAKVIFINTSNYDTGKKSIWVMDIDGANRTQLFIDGEMPIWM